ncbi:Dabb family protein [Chitinophaga solisilvae]|uniref:Dabb family protein n=1 Tax=Chitinophaga solisilvae TaxID=1233460 RepID=A0A3S1JE29_9BACT|nr:Dabb family protein [Chitinophaga solisilvae]NSL89515.1 Dabb family protein [Chitinophaga solisilvae]
MKALDKKFVHVVNFYLKSGLSEEQIRHFETGMSSLHVIDEIRVFNVGRPAATDRPTIDRSYSYSVLMIFDNQEGHDIYQVHPVHRQFVENCKQYWEKAVIFDAETI